jgi:deoxycytidylate deaminase
MIGKTNKAYFRAAKAVSELSDYPRHKLGCVIVKGHRVISSGHNHKHKCNPLQAKLDTEKYGVECPGKLHAEIMALLPLIRDKIDLRNASIYIHRQHKDGTLAMAKPCSSCQKMIRQLGIKKIFYTIESGYAVEKW